MEKMSIGLDLPFGHYQEGRNSLLAVTPLKRWGFRPYRQCYFRQIMAIWPKRRSSPEHYILDSSAFLALFEDEDGSETVQNLLETAIGGQMIIFVSFVSFTEIFYITFREKGEEEAKKQIKLMNRLAITRVESSQELGLIAGRLKATHKISFADAWITATAIFYNATLVHKDRASKNPGF